MLCRLLVRYNFQVLDEFFRIIDILKKSHDKGGTLTIDIHELLKDLRDLSRYVMRSFTTKWCNYLVKDADLEVSST